MEITTHGTTLCFSQKDLSFTMERDGNVWKWREGYQPKLSGEEGELFFSQAEKITHEKFQSSIGQGIHSRYEGFFLQGKEIPYCFETLVWVEDTTGEIYWEWIPIQEEGFHVERVYWPGEMEFDEEKDSWYTLLNQEQGMLIPNTWKEELKPLLFDGFFGTAGSYMPWFGQVKEQAGYIAICMTPWNGGCHAEHPAGGPYTHVGIYWGPSLGKMDYRRIVRYTLLSNCDYNDLCKVYRSYVKEQGKLRTLEEKAIQNASVNDLIGCVFVHQGIKTHVDPASDFYDKENPEKNNHLTTFQQREQEMRELHKLGIKKLYLHLDGWAQPGYDNQHPDYLPACKEAGGWEGMKSLVDTMHKCGYLFGIHDQYRDYYLSAPSFDENFACRQVDGTIPKHQRWAGGPQSYLCGTQAPYYVRRNFTVLKEHGISLDAAYLDVFTCNEGDECNNPMHRMTRRECYEFRCQCFSYLLSQGILTSSEEVSDWAVPDLIFCHYAPYDFMLRIPGSPKQGIPVPLYNLVYHDCVIQPWMMDKVSEEEDYMLYALLNGGAPYLIRDGAYPDFDGAFSDSVLKKLEEDKERCKIVAELHEQVAKCEMVHHEMNIENPMIQTTVFSNGTKVIVDFEKQTYEIKEDQNR